jgi:polyribonucleotide nucleotidyltransferase
MKASDIRVENMKERTYTLPELGLEVVLGKYAGQADGAAWIKKGGTVILSTVVSAEVKDFPGFKPLTVDYRELFSAAGKIPGGYFKREGRFSDPEILRARLIDRAIRPLFPDNYFNQVQVLSTVYSVDKEHVPYVLALLASSIALVVSKIPFLEPVGVAEIARVNGKWIVNPDYTQLQSADAKLIVAGTEHGINMVEGSSIGMSESECIDAFFIAHEVIKKQVLWQREIAKDYGIHAQEEAVDLFDWSLWKKRVETAVTLERVKPLFTADKLARASAQRSLKESLLQECHDQAPGQELPVALLSYLFDIVLADVVSELCCRLGYRVDTRPFDKVRDITTEVGLLPSAHGSSLFKRGRTQALISVTLGGGQDAARVDRLMGETVENTFMLHYNFPSFSVGEVKPLRGPGRREIGHGHLAASALESILPAQEQFPYTMRIVADMLESDGSTSMATVCGSIMALMDAGVPIKHMVSGVAMGLLRSQEGEFQVLTDIAGIEDAYGLMDFKVAGTTQGITAIQMDIKYKGGLERAVFEKALTAALKGRQHILSEMQKVMKQPRAALSSLVPQVIAFKVSTDKIGAIIGTGGKVIREITEKTSTSIDIADDGLVKIFGQPGEKLEQAIMWVKALGGVVERGTRYQGTIKRLAEFGLFVEIAPGLDGLVHISTIPRAEQQSFMKQVKVGEIVTVEVLDFDPSSGKIRLMIVR